MYPEKRDKIPQINNCDVLLPYCFLKALPSVDAEMCKRRSSCAPHFSHPSNDGNISVTKTGSPRKAILSPRENESGSLLCVASVLAPPFFASHCL